MVRVVAAALVVSLLTGAGGAAAAAASATPAFSTSRDDVAVMLWLRRNTSLRAGQSVVFGDDSVLVILSDTVDAARPSVHRVGFRQEATKLDFVSRTGGRSVRGAADVDCVTGRVKAQSIALYSGQDLSGDQIVSQGPDLDFRAPVYGTASALVVGEVCQQRRPNPQIASAPPPPAPSRPPVQIAPIGPPAPRSPPIAQAPLPPPAPPRPPEPAPASTPAPAPAPAPTTAPPRPAPPAPAPAPAPRTVELGVMAQIGAFSSREAAESAWSKLSATYPAQLSGKTVRIEPAIVSGQQVFRTSVEGFASEAAARTACAELMARSQACFVRRAAP